MPDPQSPAKISEILDRLVGRVISDLQVLGINSLKSVVPTPAELTGARVESASVDARVILLRAQTFTITIDLQRTGRLVWSDALPSDGALSGPRPTVRLLLAPRGRIDFTEPSKTKRITVRIADG